MIVLLVYGEAAEPATLILHGNDGQTWVSVTNDAIHRTDEKLMNSIQQALVKRARAGI
jgi:streptogramin lyase